jgi:hypothetical protein
VKLLVFAEAQPMKLPKITPINFLNGVGIAATLYLLVLLGQTVIRNYTLSKQIDSLGVQIDSLKNQKDELAFNIQYYQTDSFREREARAKLGLQAPGENVLSLPANTPAPTATPVPAKTAKTKSNFRQWMDFFTGSAI